MYVVVAVEIGGIYIYIYVAIHVNNVSWVNNNRKDESSWPPTIHLRLLSIIRTQKRSPE